MNMLSAADTYLTAFLIASFGCLKGIMNLTGPICEVLCYKTCSSLILFHFHKRNNYLFSCSGRTSRSQYSFLYLNPIKIFTRYMGSIFKMYPKFDHFSSHPFLLHKLPLNWFSCLCFYFSMQIFYKVTRIIFKKLNWKLLICSQTL